MLIIKTEPKAHKRDNMKKKKYIIGLCLCLLAPFSSLQATTHGEYIVYDYIIVGNGSAGSILARKLSDDNKTKVLVLEAGVNQDNDPAVLDFSYSGQFFSDLTSITYNPKYAETYAIPTGTLAAMPYSEGRGWGGSSKHNYFVAVRGSMQIWETIANASGNYAAWNYNSLLPLMQAIEDYVACGTTPNAAQRGTSGPITLSQLGSVVGDPVLGPIATAAGVGGYLTDYNDPTSVPSLAPGLQNVGVSACQVFASLTTPCNAGFGILGVRSFSSREFLDPIVTQSGSDYYTGKGKRLLRIQNDCHVSRVLFDGVKAKGVEFVYANGKKTGKAYGKKIILCAGAINSPAILQRSGIGDPAVLEPLGIKVLVNNPNVGANLQNQYGTYVFSSTGSGAILGEAFLNCSSQGYPVDSTRRIQLSVLPQGPTITQIAVFLTNPTSRGFIKIVSKDPLIQPFINLNMYSDGPVTQLGTDANLVAAGINIIGNALGTLIAPPQAAVGNPTALFAYMTSANGLVAESHILSTTQMGTSLANGVVDGNLQVIGVERLMVADIGVLPYSIDGNLCLAAYLIALRAATFCGVSAVPAL